MLNEHPHGMVFLLWATPAQIKFPLSIRFKHQILVAPHPSPLCHRGFLGCQHFSKTNALLKQMGRGEIDWGL